jgi:hypothetical protein
MNPIRPLGPAVKAEVTADLNGLPHTRITEQDGAAHVFTNGLADLELWFLALGGSITCHPAGPGVVLWTLTTDTDHGHGALIGVHAPATSTEQIDASLTNAVRPHVA